MRPLGPNELETIEKGVFLGRIHVVSLYDVAYQVVCGFRVGHTCERMVFYFWHIITNRLLTISRFSAW